MKDKTRQDNGEKMDAGASASTSVSLLHTKLMKEQFSCCVLTHLNSWVVFTRSHGQH